MQDTDSDPVVTLTQSRLQELLRQLSDKDEKITDLTAQLEWFKRQVFGVKSEKRSMSEEEQLALFAALKAAVPSDKVPTTTIPEHQRRKHRTGEEVNDTGLRFGPDVPVRVITLSCPELSGPDAHEYEIIGTKISQRLARQPGSHVVLQYERPVVKHKDSGKLITTAAPLGVLDHAQVDVSFLAGLLIDKFVYHCVPRARPP